MSEEIKSIAASLKTEKQKAEGKIAGIVAEFEKSTGLAINYITVDRSHNIDGRITFTAVEIKLGAL